MGFSAHAIAVAVVSELGNLNLRRREREVRSRAPNYYYRLRVQELNDTDSFCHRDDDLNAEVGQSCVHLDRNPRMELQRLGHYRFPSRL